MGEVVLLIVLSMAVWRLAALITSEDGPADIATGLRSMLPQSSWLGRGIRCIWCVSFWLGLVVGILLELYLLWSWQHAIAFGLALSTGAILIQCLIVRGSE